MLNDVRHVPNLCMNLLSEGVLDNELYASTFKKAGWKLTKGTLVVAKGNKNGTLYYMKGHSCKGELNAIYVEKLHM